MLVLYVAVFVFWKYFPSRASFVGGALVVAGVLAAGMVVAARRGYFVNRVDLLVHLYVIVDILLEGVAFEGLRFGMALGPENQWLVHSFHNNNNFLGCTAGFALIIGAHRYYVMRKQARQQASGEAKHLSDQLANPEQLAGA